MVSFYQNVTITNKIVLVTKCKHNGGMVTKSLELQENEKPLNTYCTQNRATKQTKMHQQLIPHVNHCVLSHKITNCHRWFLALAFGTAAWNSTPVTGDTLVLITEMTATNTPGLGVFWGCNTYHM